MTVAVIGGSGFARWDRFRVTEAVDVATDYAPQSVRLFRGVLGEHEIMFIPRHGSDHTVPPHRINYRANMRALRDAGVGAVLATATVGGISSVAVPGSLLIPDQILDYTCDRDHTFFDGTDGTVGHVDMTEPYCEPLRARLLDAAQRRGIAVIAGGTYAATQGPRFETSAEIHRLERDGADVVGMTGMPEAALAKELQLAYAVIAIVVNPAAGRAEGAISMDMISRWSVAGRSRAEALLEAVIPVVHDEVFPVPPPLTP